MSCGVSASCWLGLCRGELHWAVPGFGNDELELLEGERLNGVGQLAGGRRAARHQVVDIGVRHAGPQQFDVVPAGGGQLHESEADVDASFGWVGVDRQVSDLPDDRFHPCGLVRFEQVPGGADLLAGGVGGGFAFVDGDGVWFGGGAGSWLGFGGLGERVDLVESVFDGVEVVGRDVEVAESGLVGGGELVVAVTQLLTADLR